MTPEEANIITHNLFTIANHIHQGAHYFRIEETKDKLSILKENNFIQRFLFYPFYSSQSHVNQLERFIHKTVQLTSKLNRKQFIEEESEEVTELFLAAQKYNQTLARAQAYKLSSPSALINRMTLGLIQNDHIPEINPTKVIAIKEGEIPLNLQGDQPEIVKERRFFKLYNIRRYPGDHIDHSQEAGHIFTSTQKERILSLIGRIIETVANRFGFEMTTFQKYHYRKNNEIDEQIYTHTKPLSLSTEPTSYWLGHATLFLSVPLKSDKGTISSFNVITDPVEGDLNSLLYPRQTKFARSIEETPAPNLYLLSHNHLDHYSKETVKKIFAQQPVMIVPKGDGNRYRAIAKELGFNHAHIVEIDWWQKKEIEFEKNSERFHMQITATPSRHWSGQGPCGGHESTFLGYVIQGNENGDIYFAGDTARLNDEHIQKLEENFNIRWNFQPGGPDETRKDMESTHQASVDGLWMHFRMMIPRIYEKGMAKNKFLKSAKELKTIYMHTMTFKLGNLHLSETKDSLEKVLSVLSSYEETNTQIEIIEEKVQSQISVIKEKLSSLTLSEKQREKLESKIAQQEIEIRNQYIEIKLGLKSYEKQVYDELCELAKELEFAENERLLPHEIAQLLQETVIVPKIGSRLGLETQKADQLEQTYF